MTLLRRAAVALLMMLSIAPSLPGQQKPWPIRGVIVVTFADTKDVRGEFGLWVEREHLSEVLDFPGGAFPLRTNADHTLLGMVSGTTLVNATASMMALGLDPRFDLTHAYFLINGIAGVNPDVASIGSAAWARYAINDVTRELDAREMPAEWPYGFFPMGSRAPDPAVAPASNVMRSNLYPLNPKLAHWAYLKTKDLKLLDEPAAASFRAKFAGYPNAQKPPFVLEGESFASDYFWHGVVLNKFAEHWVRMWTAGNGVFAMTEMEDSGFMEAVERLDRMHRVDHERVMLLRTGSNYTIPQPGTSAAESLNQPYTARNMALESAWLCGSTVLHELIGHWDKWGSEIPGE